MGGPYDRKLLISGGERGIRFLCLAESTCFQPFTMCSTVGKLPILHVSPTQRLQQTYRGNFGERAFCSLVGAAPRTAFVANKRRT